MSEKKDLNYYLARAREIGDGLSDEYSADSRVCRLYCKLGFLREVDSLFNELFHVASANSSTTTKSTCIYTLNDLSRTLFAVNIVHPDEFDNIWIARTFEHLLKAAALIVENGLGETEREIDMCGDKARKECDK
jgi:hypothetical protein